MRPVRCTLLLPLLGPLFLVLSTAPPAKAPASQDKPVGVSADPNDWPMYTRDVIGPRFTPAEKTLGKDTVGKLVEKWRFPPADSKETIGVVHATAVVNGHVYFGT